MASDYKLKTIDLFCGIGGLSHGLVKEGFDVVAGIDNDESCRFGYERNNDAKFIHKDILQVSAEEINRLFGDEKNIIKVLVGCAPCQAFSKLNLKEITEKQMEPLVKFADLIRKTLPDIVSMENVGSLANADRLPILKTFLDALEENDYRYKYEVVDTSEYGIPQKRRRLVLLASRLGKIELIERTHKNKKVTVRQAIGNLEPVRAGEVSEKDPLHRARNLSPLNLERIKATPHDGGSSKSWNEELLLKCHKKDSGKTYGKSVYGRMRWDEPAPTMTTQCLGIGNGRFGHPEQDRAISLREAAIFQTFPDDYEFVPPKEPIFVSRVTKFIGNAVPVKLGSVIGKSIKRHVEEHVSR